ncbi:hypothetical protein [Antarcticimicrobium luteum]|uniref:Uncharacterized protein n=1 Tax=Antarcticimicrobium luteum TaxID=2547397 RepID=A0A4R5V743_9RHOB|nr:hypothetical protein [Antarcticimicrobium luteum]TDK47425.1 hypothetical protein E1832_11105 [Antarcticimicrobium luteum]
MTARIGNNREGFDPELAGNRMDEGEMFRKTAKNGNNPLSVCTLSEACPGREQRVPVKTPAILLEFSF